MLEAADMQRLNAMRETDVASNVAPVVSTATIDCVLVDPSLYTGPYDAALTAGLIAAGVRPYWVTRPTRPGDRQEIPPQFVAELFYRRTDHMPRVPGALRSMLKGIAHVIGLVRLARVIDRRRPQLVHFQWTVLPLFDSIAVWWIRRRRPVVLTVHDPVPFNGQRVPLLWRLGFYLPIRLASAVIVHTQSGRKALLARGIPPAKLFVVPHGPLTLGAQARPRIAHDTRYSFVLFGEIKPYKGVDLVVEAVRRLPPNLLTRARVIVAGRPRMDIEPILDRIAELSLGRAIEVEARRLTEQEMADLFDCADYFLFPYRVIDASGVYFLTKSLRKWLIATRVGVFADEIVSGGNGQLVDAEDIDGLAQAMAHAIEHRPVPKTTVGSSSWTAIGRMTLGVYRATLESHS